MNFCSNCGYPVSLKFIEGEHPIPRYFCENCKTVHYQNPKIIVGCVPLWKEQTMLCKRGIEPQKGFWNLPGGFMENGETVEAGAAREALEETGVEADILSLHSVYTVISVNQVHLHFLANIRSLDFQTNAESMEISLFEEREIPWHEIAFASNYFALRCFFEDRRKGARELHLGQWNP